MFGFALIVVGVLVTVVLPQITELLASLNQPLPFYTRAIIEMARFMKSYWWAVAAALLAVAILIRAVLRTQAGRASVDRMKLRLPVVGRTVRLLAISRFTRTLSTLLAGGLPIVRALDTAKHVANNVVLGAAIDAARDSVTEGQSLAQPLRASGEFPPIVVHMVEVGERSGELESMLEKIAQTYEDQVETSVTRLTALLEPLLILLMVGSSCSSSPRRSCRCSRSRVRSESEGGPRMSAPLASNQPRFPIVSRSEPKASGDRVTARQRTFEAESPVSRVASRRRAATFIRPASP